MLFKAITLTTMTPMAAGLVATGGGAAATYYQGAHHTLPGAAYGVTVHDHYDPNHVDPGGEFVHIEDAPVIGTAAVNFNILGPGD